MSVRAENLNFAYEENLILKDIALHIPPNQVSTIIGTNGIGKSTLLRCLANIYQPQSGAIYLNGKDIAAFTATELARELGYVPQVQSDVFPLTVYEAILLGRKPYIRWSVRSRDLAVVDAIVERFNLGEFSERKISTLSGGERQKVALARALAQEPSMLFLDEPTSNLDLAHQLELMELVVELTSTLGSTVVMVLHDLNLAARFSDQVFLLDKSGVYAHGTPKSVLTSENIAAVYSVEVEVLSTPYGPYIVPVKRLEKEVRA